MFSNLTDGVEVGDLLGQDGGGFHTWISDLFAASMELRWTLQLALTRVQDLPLPAREINLKIKKLKDEGIAQFRRLANLARNIRSEYIPVPYVLGITVRISRHIKTGRVRRGFAAVALAPLEDWAREQHTSFRKHSSNSAHIYIIQQDSHPRSELLQIIRCHSSLVIHSF